MNNFRIREELKRTGMKYWQLARLLGMSDATLSRHLRDEFSDEEQDRIVNLIREKTERQEE